MVNKKEEKACCYWTRRKRIEDVVHLQDISLNSVMCGYSYITGNPLFIFKKQLFFVEEFCSQTIIV